MKFSKTTYGLGLAIALAATGSADAQRKRPATPRAPAAAKAPATKAPAAQAQPAAPALSEAEQAQAEQQQQQQMATGLDLPANLEIFGKQDPNVRKPTAIVNRTVITGTDVDQRVNMILALNPEAKVEGDELQRLKLQVLRQLIDESLELGSAQQLEISPKKAEVDGSMGRVLANMNRTPQQMDDYLRSRGSSLASLRRQVEAEVAWSRVQRRKIDINVSDDEVNAIIERLKADRGADEYNVAEIFLAAGTPDQQAQQSANAQRIMAEIRKQTRPFRYFAANFSDATTRAVGGDLGWVRPAQLPEALATNLVQMQPGQIAGPIDVGGGFSIIFLQDKRKILTADPRDAKVDLRQITVDFPAGTTKAQATVLAQSFAQQTGQIRGCGDVQAVADRLKAKVVTSDQNRIRDLPAALQEILLKMQVGQATPPFGAIESGVRTLVLCGRDDPAGGNLPSANQLKAGLEEQRTNRVAQRMLRDLRRDAVIEYK